MPLNKFSIADVRKIVNAGVKGRWSDGGGLCLQINAGGGASWVFRFRAPDGTRREMGLGPLHTVTLAAAREAARLARVARHGGADPIGHRTVTAVTFAQCVTDCIAERDTHKQPTVGWQTILNHAGPVLGAMSVAAIKPEDVLRAIKPFWVDRPQTAVKLRRYIETVIDYATIAKHLREPGQNPAAWDVLKCFGLKPAKELIEEKVRHHPSLLPAELPAFMRELAAVKGGPARALEFMILTASRTGDLTGQKAKPHEGAKPPMLWTHVDLDQRVWTIPEDKVGNVNFQVPLSDAVVALLRALPREGGRVFGTWSRDAMWEVLKTIRPDLTPHGFRSSFTAWAKNSGKFADDLVEVALKHRVAKNDVQKAYSAHVDYLAPRARLMQAWAEFATGAEVHTVVHLRASS